MSRPVLASMVKLPLLAACPCAASRRLRRARRSVSQASTLAGEGGGRVGTKAKSRGRPPAGGGLGLQEGGRPRLQLVHSACALACGAVHGECTCLNEQVAWSARAAQPAMPCLSTGAGRRRQGQGHLLCRAFSSCIAAGAPAAPAVKGGRSTALDERTLQQPGMLFSPCSALCSSKSRGVLSLLLF